MSPEFAFPDWASPPDPSPPSPPPAVDGHRVGDLVNGFIAAKQDALFDAGDALYRQSGADAVTAAPAVTRHLGGLRDAVLGQAADDGERQALQGQLDAQLADALDGIDRHVSRERKAQHREILAQRQRLIERSAALEHNNEAKLSGLAEASAGTAKLLARFDGAPEEATMQAARSAVWRTAIGERIATGQGVEALGLFQRVQHQLSAADQRMLATPVQAARTDAAAGEYGERHPWSKEHKAYNAAVQELWDKAKFNPAEMTKKDAQGFLDQVMRSKDPRIATFRSMINDKRAKYERDSRVEPRGGTE